jgi:uncharacterized repeat protein (TIGR03837 family)
MNGAGFTWDLFCRVIDNWGDIGVCWRLAADLASRGQRVRLHVDDAAALAWMAPGGAEGVDVLPWNSSHDPGDVVIEAFGCDPPGDFVRRMTSRKPPPVWINLEYLTAQAYAGRSHGLPSPQHGGPGAGLVKHFFYPGFDSHTGGLIREPTLGAQQAAFDAEVWLAQHGVRKAPGERLASVFCYPAAPMAALYAAMGHSGRAWRLLIAGAPAVAVPTAANVATQALPLLDQPGYDRLLWSCDLNFVRGEDSWVRAQWAARPFVWQAYPQHDDAHHVKLQAFLDRMLAAAPAELATSLRQGHAAWNGLLPDADVPQALQNLLAHAAHPPAAWAQHVRQWRDSLVQQADLGSRLLAFAHGLKARGS